MDCHSTLWQLYQLQMRGQSWPKQLGGRGWNCSSGRRVLSHAAAVFHLIWRWYRHRQTEPLSWDLNHRCLSASESHWDLRQPLHDQWWCLSCSWIQRLAGILPQMMLWARDSRTTLETRHPHKQYWVLSEEIPNRIQYRTCQHPQCPSSFQFLLPRGFHQPTILPHR